MQVDVFILESRNLSSLAVSAAGKELYSADQRELAQNGRLQEAPGLPDRAPAGRPAESSRLLLLLLLLLLLQLIR